MVLLTRSNYMPVIISEEALRPKGATIEHQVPPTPPSERRPEPQPPASSWRTLVRRAWWVVFPLAFGVEQWLKQSSNPAQPLATAPQRSPAAPDPTSCKKRWCAVEPEEGFRESIYSVWGRSDGDVWLAASNRLLHFDGLRWTTYPIKGVSKLHGTRSGEVWALGWEDHGETGRQFVLRWDGSDWSPVDLDTKQGLKRGEKVDLYAVWASGADDTWIAAEATSETSSRLMLFHRNDKNWTTTSPKGLDISPRAMWGSSPEDIWIVGMAEYGKSAAVHWDGNRWRPGTGAVVGQSLLHTLTAVWGRAPADVWAAGPGGAIVHWDGTTWTQTPSHTTESLHGIWGLADGSVWAVGNKETLIRWNGTEWGAVAGAQPAARPMTAHLNVLWGNATKLWTAGTFGRLLWYQP